MGPAGRKFHGTHGMTEPEKDTQRALAAAKLIIDGRDPIDDMGAIMVTLENHVALVLMAVMNKDHAKAAAMLNEGLVQGVEERLANAVAKAGK